MNYEKFAKQYPYLTEEDYQEYLSFLASREQTEAWHQSVNPERMKEFFETALPNWRARNQYRPTPKLEYLISYAEEWVSRVPVKISVEDFQEFSQQM